ncbi:carboxylesterase/lipase family protein [Terriglobus tenax]|uniref:carboxylesterase/lipase family protein n=1 Tax=Terriglobus tenax TaxID=1111115 RepID=UPI0021E063AD|nr:carboxylesterase family protein [Terriglobus tenax]
MAAVAMPSWASLTPVVAKTQAGEVEGVLEGGVRVFRGVPFAEPPVGTLRFRPPVPVKPWKGVRQAKSFAAAAMQPGSGVSEDCLYLNVWAPAEKRPHPVYVWIHGGGMTGGRSSDPMFDGRDFAREGVVVVTIAYRLGVFGFLEMEPMLGKAYRGSANNGLRDAIEALRWVKTNIAAFGGDPSRVTIGGESAGAKIVDLLLASEQATGLFRQAISQSGGEDRCFSLEASHKVGEEFGAFWDKSGEDEIGTVESGKLLARQTAFLAQWPGWKYPLRAQADGMLLPIVPLEGVERLAKGRRVLIGTNRDESAAFIGAHPGKEPVQAELSNLSLERFAPVYGRYEAVYPQMETDARHVRAVTAEEYWVPTVRVAEAVARGGAEVYMYRLDYPQTGGALAGTSPHGFDLHLTWERPQANNVDAAVDAAMAQRVHAAWLGFIRGETPKLEGAPLWPGFEVRERKTMVLDVASRVETMPQEKELSLWEGLLEGAPAG